MKILKSLSKIFNLFSTTKVQEDILQRDSIKEDFIDSEKIARTIFSPFNFKKNRQNFDEKSALNKNAFETPPEKDEVSVNRFQYTTADNLKNLGKLIDIPSDENRNYCGVAIIDVAEIKSSGADIVYSPMYINNEKVSNFPNPYHSDIKIGFVKERGKPLPQQYSFRVSKMVEICRYYPDPNPEEKSWNGGDLL